MADSYTILYELFTTIEHDLCVTQFDVTDKKTMVILHEIMEITIKGKKRLIQNAHEKHIQFPVDFVITFQNEKKRHNVPDILICVIGALKRTQKWTCSDPSLNRVVKALQKDLQKFLNTFEKKDVSKIHSMIGVGVGVGGQKRGNPFEFDDDDLKNNPKNKKKNELWDDPWKEDVMEEEEEEDEEEDEEDIVPKYQPNHKRSFPFQRTQFEETYRPDQSKKKIKNEDDKKTEEERHEKIDNGGIVKNEILSITDTYLNQLVSRVESLNKNEFEGFRTAMYKFVRTMRPFVPTESKPKQLIKMKENINETMTSIQKKFNSK